MEIDRDGGILTSPVEEGISLTTVHVFLNVEYYDIVIGFHLECDSSDVLYPGTTEDELELYVMSDLASVGVDWSGVTGVGRSDEMTAFVGRVD
jgi:hypothetical protein